MEETKNITKRDTGQEELPETTTTTTKKKLEEAENKWNNVMGTIINTSQGAQNQILKLVLLPSHEDFNQCLHSMSVFNYGEQLCSYIDRASKQLLRDSF